MDKADHAACVVHLQQAVDGGSLAARQLTQPLGGTAGRGAEGHPLGLIFQQLQNSVHGGGLAGAGAACQHQTVFGHGLADGLFLERCIGKALCQLQNLDVFIQITGGILPPPGQHGQPVGNVLLGVQQVWQVDIGHILVQFHPQLFGLQAAVQSRRQLFRRLVDEIGGSVQQLAPRQAGMAVARVVTQGAQEGSFQPLGAVPCHVVILSNAVRMAEIQLQRLPAEQIGVLGNGVHGTGAKGAEDLHSPPGADLKLSQIGDELPHPEHPLEFLLDAVGLIRRDAWDRGELGRVIGDDLQRLGTEFIKDLVRRPGTDIRQ